MSTYPDLKNEDPTLLKITTKDDEVKDLKFKKEKHGRENVLKSPKLDNEYDKKYKTLKKRNNY